MSTNFIPHLRTSLEAKIVRLLSRPVVARIVATPDEPAWGLDELDGTRTVQIDIDYSDLWLDREKEVLDQVRGTLETDVALLTNEQRELLERSPQAFLAMNPRPETATLLDYKQQAVGGRAHIKALRLAASLADDAIAHLAHVAIVPNLVPLERQLEALRTLEQSPECPLLAPLHSLLVTGDTSRLISLGDVATEAVGKRTTNDNLDEFQQTCLARAEETPHFALINGPPGSGKTKVISNLVRSVVERGGRVLVVSSTHVAVDNVVERLGAVPAKPASDSLEPFSIPVRYASRRNKLTEAAKRYWVGVHSHDRDDALAERVRLALTAKFDFARELVDEARTDDQTLGPISMAVGRTARVICGTPIGMLSYGPVKDAASGAFELLVVDEVSKMTLPEFLAIAIKARRWVLVGDPMQLPVFNDTEDNAVTLDDVMHPELELACSTAVMLWKAPGGRRSGVRIVVVAHGPLRVADAIRAQLAAVMPGETVSVCAYGMDARPGVVVCSPAEVQAACDFNRPVAGTIRDRDPRGHGNVQLLVERGLRVTLETPESAVRFVDASARAQARLFEAAFKSYHEEPWRQRTDPCRQPSRTPTCLDMCIPSQEAIHALGLAPGEAATSHSYREHLTSDIAARYMVNAVSMYDWLVLDEATSFDLPPLRELRLHRREGLMAAVAPFVATLKKQYRMHASLSQVPREVFYFGEALLDGVVSRPSRPRVRFVKVASDSREGECNTREVQEVARTLKGLDHNAQKDGSKPTVMILTPYRMQEEQLGLAVNELRRSGDLSQLTVEVCTLDRCQGREADYVVISLVRNRVTPFLDMPKRWNVALTRAKDGLILVGDIDAFRDEARRASDARRRPTDRSANARPMSVIARVIQAYDRQLSFGGAR